MIGKVTLSRNSLADSIKELSETITSMSLKYSDFKPNATALYAKAYEGNTKPYSIKFQRTGLLNTTN